MKVIIIGNWSNCTGTEYYDALGIYPNLKLAQSDASDYAWDFWEPQEVENEEDGLDYDGPDYFIEEYVPSKHDCFRTGGGSFEEEFARMQEHYDNIN